MAGKRTWMIPLNVRVSRCLDQSRRNASSERPLAQFGEIEGLLSFRSSLRVLNRWSCGFNWRLVGPMSGGRSGEPLPQNSRRGDGPEFSRCGRRLFRFRILRHRRRPRLHRPRRIRPAFSRTLNRTNFRCRFSSAPFTKFCPPLLFGEGRLPSRFFQRPCGVCPRRWNESNPFVIAVNAQIACFRSE
jgi:hypothetical protein